MLEWMKGAVETFGFGVVLGLIVMFALSIGGAVTFALAILEYLHSAYVGGL